VPVEPDLGDQDANFSARSHFRLPRDQKSVAGMKLPKRRRQTSTISPTLA
jgi:hypothetical protein